MKTFHIIIYGCQMNYSDAARIKAVLTNCGWVHVDNIDHADIVILDTCSVRQKSEDKVRGQLKELRKDQKAWLTGCMIQHNLNLKKARTTKSRHYTMGNFSGDVSTLEPTIVGLEKLQDEKHLKDIVRDVAQGKDDRRSEILYVNHAFDPLFAQMQRTAPQVELFFRINDLGFIPAVMRKLGYDVKEDVDVISEYTGIIPHNANQLFKENTKTAYVPISTGCSQFCAYCIVPYARGLEKNRPFDEIITEVKEHLNQGVEEIVLLGQIVNKHPDFAKILRAVSELPGVRRLRYTSPYPTYYDDEILSLHESQENICPHIHMPLQSGSDAVLKKMFRGYTSDEYRTFVDQIRGLKRPISITSDIIVGFCDETEEDFQQSIELTKYAMFDMVYIGIYSPRPGTYAAKKYEDNIPLEIKKQRRASLNDVLTECSAQNNLHELGKTRSVLIKGLHDDGTASGYTDHMKNIVLKNINPDLLRVGAFTQAIVNDTKSFTLYGEVVKSERVKIVKDQRLNIKGGKGENMIGL